ncbi:Bifunctional metallophosphatase/5'-nucleotidase OS=Streptomyces alboniger OX=132473 GN=CP975_16450 PE=3 SV=1 [Streptomyces alboniger]
MKSANHVVTRTVPKATDMTALIGRWNTLAAPIGNRAIGYISADVPSTGTESPMGDLIADAQLWYGRELDAETDLALMNPGGVRAGLTYAAKGSEGDGVVTYAEGFTVQPFSNTVNLQDFTGAQLIQVLKEQVSGTNSAAPKILQPSANLTYTLDLTKTGADRVVTDSIKVNGAAIEPGRHLPRRDEQLPRGRRRRLHHPGPGHETQLLVGTDDLTALEQYPDGQFLGRRPDRAAGGEPHHDRAVANVQRSCEA